MFGTEGLIGKTILFCLVNGFDSANYLLLSNCFGQQGASNQVASFIGEDNLSSSDGQIGVVSDMSFTQAADGQFDAVIIADNVTAEAVKDNSPLQWLLEETWSLGKSAVVCIGEGAKVLIASGIVKDKEVAVPPDLADALRNAGGKPSDKQLINDENIFSATEDADMQMLCREITYFLTAGHGMRRAA